MTQAIETFRGMVVPESVLVKVERKDRYGRVPGLDDEELADSEELERQVLKEEFEPILMLPVTPRRGWARPAVDEDGSVDWGAFGTVDFERYSGGFDRARHKAEMLREQLKDKLILLALVKERLPGKAKYLVLKYVRMGIITLEHIASDDMLAAARLYLQARQLQKELWQVQEAARKREQRVWERWLDALG